MDSVGGNGPTVQAHTAAGDSHTALMTTGARTHRHVAFVTHTGSRAQAADVDSCLDTQLRGGTVGAHLGKVRKSVSE